MNKIYKNENGFSVLEAILILVIIVAITGVGWFVWHSKQIADKNLSSTNSSNPVFKRDTKAKTATTEQNPTQPANPYAGWKKYTSSFEGLSFEYPPNWQSVTPKITSPDPSADSFEVQGPTGSVPVSWISSVSGIGGACNSQIAPGTKVSAGSTGPCPYWTVLHSQKLTNANLFYVDGVVTYDGTTYSPWCALQASSGIVNSESNIGYLLFNGQHSNQAGLICGEPFNSGGLLKGTKAQATTFLSTTEAQQAKLILLSASY